MWSYSASLFRHSASECLINSWICAVSGFFSCCLLSGNYFSFLRVLIYSIGSMKWWRCGGRFPYAIEWNDGDGRASLPIEPRTLSFRRKNLFTKKRFFVISRTHLSLFIKPTSRAFAKERGLLQKKQKLP